MQKLIDAFVVSLVVAVGMIAVGAVAGFSTGMITGVARDKIEGTPGKYEHEYAIQGRDIGLQIGFVASELVGRTKLKLGGARVAGRVSPRASTPNARLRSHSHATQREPELTPLEEAGESLLQSYVMDRAQGTGTVGFRSEEFGIADRQLGEIWKVACPAAWQNYENIAAFEAFRLTGFREAYKHAIAQVPRDVWNDHKSWLTLSHSQSSPSVCIQTQAGIYVLLESSQPYGIAELFIIFDPSSKSLAIRIYDGVVHRVVGSSKPSLRTIASSKRLMQWQSRG